MKPLEKSRQYVQAGLSITPIATDGSKRPAGPWKKYQQKAPSEAELCSLFKDACGIGVICGEVSGRNVSTTLRHFGE